MLRRIIKRVRRMIGDGPDAGFHIVALLEFVIVLVLVIVVAVAFLYSLLRSLL